MRAMLKNNIKISLSIFFVLFFFLSPGYSKELEADELNIDSSKKGEYTLILFFQMKDGNDIVFYDKNGRSIWLKYRLDRWDYTNDNMVENLQQGYLYQVTFENEMVAENNNEKKDVNARLARKIENRMKGTFKYARNFNAENLIY